ELQDAPGLLELPLDKPRPAVQEYSAGQATRVCSSELRARVKQSAQEAQADLAAFCLAAFAIMLKRYSRQEELVIGVPMDYRQQSELKTLPGNLSNILPLRLSLSEDLKFAELLQQVKSRRLALETHASVPFEKI